jgi:hypothetical protein
MDPVLKMWLYYQWLGDHRDDAELAKNHAYLLGSFWNAEAVHSMMNDVVHESSDEDLEESMRMVKEGLPPMFGEAPEKPLSRRKRRAVLKEQQG